MSFHKTDAEIQTLTSLTRAPKDVQASNVYNVLGMPFFNDELRIKEFEEGFNALV